MHDKFEAQAVRLDSLRSLFVFICIDHFYDFK